MILIDQTGKTLVNCDNMQKISVSIERTTVHEGAYTIPKNIFDSPIEKTHIEVAATIFCFTNSSDKIALGVYDSEEKAISELQDIVNAFSNGVAFYRIQ